MATSVEPVAVERVPDGATWPSIIPDGAHDVGARLRPGPGRPRRSARAWRRCRRGRSAVSRPQWPWSVYSSRQRSAMSTTSIAVVVAQVAQGHLHDAVGVGRAGAAGVLVLGHAEEDHAGDAQVDQLGHLLDAASPACAARRPAATGWAAASSMPSRTNSGATRSSTPSRVSATRRRSAGVRRRRRSRVWGNVTPKSYEPTGPDPASAYEMVVSRPRGTPKRAGWPRASQAVWRRRRRAPVA